MRAQVRSELSLEPLEVRCLLAADLTTGLNGNEPTVVVDPNDSNIVAVAQFRTVRISFDRGATFPVSVTVSAPNGYAGGGGDPSLSFDSQDRLYFSYLAANPAPAIPGLTQAVFAARIDVNVAAQTAAVAQNSIVALEGPTFNNDKEWIAVDHTPDSPFQGNVYLVWTQLDSPWRIMFSRSTDSGSTWSAPQQLDNGASGNVWPSEVTVAPNGDVWTAWHTNTGDTLPNSGEIRMRRSTDGGQTFQPEIVPFPAGTADVNDNAPPNPREPGNLSWWLGAVQPRVLADPIHPGTLYVVSVDDPNNAYASGDDSDVVFARSTDFGATWTRTTISHGPVGTFQIMPAATIDELGNIAVTWYDNRRGLTNSGLDGIPGNADDDFLLDVYSTVSRDGGLTFTNDFRLSDTAFDPDLGATDRFPGQNVLRIGEYIGLATGGGTVFATWTGNTAAAQQILFDKFNMLGPFADAQEPNDTLSTSTILGSPSAVTLQDQTLSNTDPADFYKYTAHDTGSLAVNLYFDTGVSNLELEALDVFGNVISAGTQTNIAPGIDQEQVLIPVVAGQEYFLRVTDPSDSPVNPVTYDLEIENFAVPQPEFVKLHPDDDNGLSNIDNVTDVDSPRIIIQADLTQFVQPTSPGGPIPILTSALAAGGVTPGAAVEVFVNGTSVGFADRLGTSTSLFQFTLLSTVLTSVLPVTAGNYDQITAAVRIFDGQQDATSSPAPATGRSLLSPPLALDWVDTHGPQITSLGVTGSPFDLFGSKSSGSPSPTPMISSLSIGISDLPARGAAFTHPALAAPVDEVEPNDTIFSAMNVDHYFNLAEDPNIGDQTQNTSTTVPHATILGTGDGTFDYYSFTVDTANTTVVIDVDGAMNGARTGEHRDLHLRRCRHAGGYERRQ